MHCILEIRDPNRMDAASEFIHATNAVLFQQDPPRWTDEVAYTGQEGNMDLEYDRDANDWFVNPVLIRYRLNNAAQVAGHDSAFVYLSQTWNNLRHNNQITIPETREVTDVDDWIEGRIVAVQTLP